MKICVFFKSYFSKFFSFLLQRRQMNRVLFQRELAQKIVEGSWEIDYAIERHKKMEDEKVSKKQEILDSKLKPKGHLLLKKK